MKNLHFYLFSQTVNNRVIIDLTFLRCINCWSKTSLFFKCRKSRNIKTEICIIQLKVTPIRRINLIMRFCNQRRNRARCQNKLNEPGSSIILYTFLLPSSFFFSNAVIYFLISWIYNLNTVPLLTYENWVLTDVLPRGGRWCFLAEFINYKLMQFKNTKTVILLKTVLILTTVFPIDLMFFII